MTIYDFFIDYELFTEEELQLVIKGWGDNLETYNTIAHVRYGYDVEQLAEKNGIMYNLLTID